MMTRTLFIGLDGFAFPILDDLIADQPGRGVVMPFMRSLLQRGFRAPLRSTPHPLTPPAWTTMFTGKNPGHHGVYDFMRSSDNGREVFFTLYDARDVRAETVWSAVSRRGYSVAALNFPMTAPPPQINGSLIPGFTSARHLRRNSTPPDLFDRLSQLPGFEPRELAWDFERENEIGSEMDDDYLEKWIRYHLPREALWYRVADHLLTTDRPDLMCVMFDGADKIQHQAWQFIDPALRPQVPDAHFNRMRQLCEDYYRRLDGYIAGLVEAAGPDTRIFMASDHGFTATTHVVRINRLLSELGHLTYHAVGDDDAAKRRAASPFAYLDWQRTKAYCPTPSSNAIRIRVAQQPGDPGVPPADYHAFREQLIAELLQCVDPETGSPMIRRVRTREEIFPGPAMAEAPDLTLELADYGFVSIRNLSPVVERRAVPAGTHHPLGIFLAAGPDIRQGVAGDEQQIADVAASLLYSLDEPIPVDYDGQVARAAFTDAHLSVRPPLMGPPSGPVETAPQTRAEAPASDAEKQKILDQLAMLGYLEE
ncbi:alkaline phosphatase family protein [uncultured Thiohalocapsa sp.]|uniref:alkaline phosphatase family protein n=1 Tax=uncultured Thiohalocapsa sp. TaxID=768990 RepID=UPI0025EC5758|nr:alkaline phosphatase family protein [uncultured Thiohalocapsa sp.]